jgi:hypothetical protein
MRSWTCPNCKGGAHLEATVPLGDAESLQRLEERTDGMTTRAAAPAPWSMPISRTIKPIGQADQ